MELNSSFSFDEISDWHFEEYNARVASLHFPLVEKYQTRNLRRLEELLEDDDSPLSSDVAKGRSPAFEASLKNDTKWHRLFEAAMTMANLPGSEGPEGLVQAFLAKNHLASVFAPLWAGKADNKISKSSQRRSFAVPLLNAFNAQYLIQIMIGNIPEDKSLPPLRPEELIDDSRFQWFTVIPDTGSKDFWIPGVECFDTSLLGRHSRCPPTPNLDYLPDPKVALPLVRTYYNLSAPGNTGRSTSEHKRLRYGDGTTVEIQGFVDTVSLVGTRTILHSAQQRMARIVDFRSLQSVMIADGILGLAADTSKPFDKSERFLNQLCSQHPGLISECKVSFYLSYYHASGLRSRMPPIRDTAKWKKWQRQQWLSQRSALIVGDPKTDKYAKRGLQYWSKAPKGFQQTSHWLVDLRSLALQNTGIEIDLTQEVKYEFGAPALVDTGTSLIILRYDIWDAIARQLTGDRETCKVAIDQLGRRFIRCPCFGGPSDWLYSLLTGINRVPTLQLTFGAAEDHPGGSRTKDNKFSLCISAAELLMKDSDEPQCRLALQRGRPNLPVPVVLGSSFLRSYYTTFDFEQQHIGFGRSIGSPLGPFENCSALPPSMAYIIVRAGVVMCLFGAFASAIGFFIWRWVTGPAPLSGPLSRTKLRAAEENTPLLTPTQSGYRSAWPSPALQRYPVGKQLVAPQRSDGAAIRSVELSDPSSPDPSKRSGIGGRSPTNGVDKINSNLRIHISEGHRLPSFDSKPGRNHSPTEQPETQRIRSPGELESSGGHNRQATPQNAGRTNVLAPRFHDVVY